MSIFKIKKKNKYGVINKVITRGFTVEILMGNQNSKFMSIFKIKKKNKYGVINKVITRGFTVFIEDITQKLILFYKEILLIPGIFLEEGFEKKPVRNENQRYNIRTIEEILNILNCKEKNRDILIDISKTDLVVFDFDIYKLKEKNTREKVKETLLKLSLVNSWTVVKSLNGGLHIYFSNKETYFEHSINKTLKCLISNVDIIRRKIVGPSIKQVGLREILHFNHFFHNVPLSFFPLATIQANKLELLKPHPSIDICWSQGNRRKTLICLLQVLLMSEELIIEINKCFFNPPKTEKELQNEIIVNLDQLSLTKNFNYIDSLATFPSLKNIYFSFKKNNFYILDQSTQNYKSIDLSEIRKILSDYIDSSNLEKYFKNYIQQLKTLNEWEDHLEQNKNFIYFQNCIFDLESKTWIEKTKNPALFQKILIRELKHDITFDDFEEIKSNELSFIKKIKYYCPQIYKFLEDKMNNFNENVKEEFIEIILLFCYAIFFKNSKSFNETNKMFQKMLWLTGFGGTGKSTVISFMEMFAIEDLSQTAEFSQINKNFESSGWVDKTFLKFSDEYASDSTDQINRNVLSVIKRLTGGDKIRVEKKFENITQKIIDPVVTVTMNYKHNFHSITDFVSLHRRIIVLNFNYFIEKSNKNINILSTLNKKELSNLFLIFSLEFSNAKNYYSRIDNFITDLVILKNKDFKNLKLTDSFFSYAYLKLFFNEEKHVSVFILVTSYISFVLFEYDTSIYLKDDNKLKKLIENIFKNPFEEYFFDLLIKHLKSIKGFFSSLDILSHLNFFQKSHFFSFFETLFARIIFLGEKFHINKIEYTSKYFKVGEWVDGIKIGYKISRIPIIKGITINSVEDLFVFSKKENVLKNTENLIEPLTENLIEPLTEKLIVKSSEKIKKEIINKDILQKDIFLQQKSEILQLLKEKESFKNIFSKYPDINKKTIWNWNGKFNKNKKEIINKDILQKDIFLQQKSEILQLLKEKESFKNIFSKYPDINKKTIWNWNGKFNKKK